LNKNQFKYIFQNVIYSLDDKAEFSASLLQSSVTWSFRNQSNMLIWSMLKTVVLL